MTKVYIDDSIHERGNFIISGMVFTTADLDDQISESLTLQGFDPNESEFKSGLSYRKYPNMINVRKDLNKIISENCQIGLVILPSSERRNIGFETLKGLKQFINSNDFSEDIEVYVDENYFRNKSIGIEYAKEIGLSNCLLNLEVDSQKVRGIQLADLAAHTCSTMLLEELNIIDKMVKAGENSGYDPELDVELGFELWSGIRDNLLGEIDMVQFDNGNGLPMKVTTPNGLFISEYCDDNLKTHVEKRFGEIYMGCYH